MFEAQLKIIAQARSKVPAVNYALGLASFGAAGSIIVYFLGHNITSAIIMVLVIIGSILVYIFSVLIQSKTTAVSQAGSVMIWTVVIFFVIFLSFTVSAVALNWPPNWVRILHMSDDATPIPPTADRLADCRGSLNDWDPEFESSLLTSYVPHKTVEPMVLCQIAADKYPADVEANFLLARALVAAGKVQQAIAQYIKSSDMGSGEASLVLGLYFSEYKEHDEQKSREYIDKAAKSKLWKAYLYLGKQYEIGTFSKIDYKEAYKYYKFAADHGVGEALFRQGQLLENGLGTERDIGAARELYRKAISLGYSNAEDALNDMS